MTAADRIAEYLGAPPSNVVRLDVHRTAQPQLPLADEPRVATTHRRSPVSPDTSQAFERAWSTYAGLDSYRRSTRRKSWPAWVTVASVVGEDKLEAAVGAWSRDPMARQSAARMGAPGFQVWLGQGRYEPFLEVAAPQAPVVARTVPDEVWNAVAGRWGPDYAASWLHEARMSERRAGTLVVRAKLGADKLLRDCKRELAAAGVSAIAASRDGQVVADYRI
jgi:hypothetical protein